MLSDFARNLRLSVAVTMVSAWGVASLAQLCSSALLLGLLVFAPLVLYTQAQWAQPIVMHSRRSIFNVLLMLVAIALIAFVISMFPRETVELFLYNPLFVVPVWLLTTLGLVKRATSMASPSPNYSLKRTAGVGLR